MKLEETIQMCFDKHPTSFENRKQVLIHIFCTFGTGFEWKNGEIVNRLEKWYSFKGKLGKDGKARQKKSLKEIAIRFLYDSTSDKNRKSQKEPVPYSEFKKRMKMVEIVLKEEGLSLETTLLKDTLSSIELLRNSHEKYITQRTRRKYSNIFNIPDDITEDWSNGLNEIKEIIKEMNINLEDID